MTHDFIPLIEEFIIGLMAYNGSEAIPGFPKIKSTFSCLGIRFRTMEI